MEKNLIIILSVVNVAVFFITPIINSSPMIYITRLLNYFEPREKVSEIDENNTDIYNELTEIKEKVDKISENEDEYNFLNSKEDLEEVYEITEKIKELQDENSEYFSELKTSKQKVQLFYKMQLGTMQYHYCNVIKAFEAYGINCEEMSIDEYKLVLWDIERLYALYNMKESIQNDLAENIFYEKKELLYDDFRVNMSKHSDIFDYEGWRMSYENKTAEQVRDSLNEYIMDYYKKFSLNFRENID